MFGKHKHTIRESLSIYFNDTFISIQSKTHVRTMSSNLSSDTSFNIKRRSGGLFSKGILI